MGIRPVKEWWEFRGVCCGCEKPLDYGAPAHRDEYSVFCQIDTSWQRRVNSSNERWRPGYRFKTTKNSGYRTYQCYYGVDRNGRVEFQGGVRCANEKETVAGWQEKCDALPAGNWFPGCELEA